MSSSHFVSTTEQHTQRINQEREVRKTICTFQSFVVTLRINWCIVRIHILYGGT